MVDPIAALQKQIEKKKVEISNCEHLLAMERGRLEGLENALRIMTKNPPSTEPSLFPAEKPPRAGTDVAKSMEALNLAGKPLHIDDLLRAIGKPVNKSSRISLAGSLAGYVRDGKWFTRTAPNTFGLIGMDLQNTTGEENPQKPVM